MTLDFNFLAVVADKLGTVLLLLLVLIGGSRRLWVFGQEYEEMKQDRDDWKALALRGTSLAERALETPPPK